jgi:uncharacterized membrane protein YgaE (UPF0421/DUF939 family)
MVQISLGSVQFTAHAINFFLYCFSTKNFRNELQDFIQEILFFSTTSKSTTTTIINSTTENTKKKYFIHRHHRDRESTIENQQTGQQFVLKDMQTVLINDE